MFAIKLAALIILGPIYLSMVAYLLARMIKRGIDTANIEHMKQLLTEFGDTTLNKSGEDDND